MHALPPHIHLADTGGSMILLDLLADRYHRLGAEEAEAVRCLIDGRGEASPAALARLAARQWVVADGRPVATAPALACDGSHLDAPNGASAAVFASWRALLFWRGSLRLLGMRRSLERIPGQASRRRRGGVDAAALALGFAEARAFAPFRRRCLPDALALKSVADHVGVDAQLVIGVRDHPFAAHAWVQAAGLALTDPWDTVRELTPILVR